jgi:CHAD domain-containing protein
LSGRGVSDGGSGTVLELCPSRAGAARLAAQLASLPGVAAQGRARRVAATWYDTADGTLGAAGMAALERGGRWRLEPLAPGLAAPAWAPGAPAPALAEGITASRLGVAAEELAETARFAGREQAYALPGEHEGVEAVLLRGTVRTDAARGAVARLRLAGSAAAVEAACAALGEALGLAVPRGSVAAGVLGARPVASEGAARDPGESVGAFIAATVARLTWPVLLECDAVGALPTAEGIHGARVAVRRLRSVLGVVREPAACAALEAVRPMLRDLAGQLGQARDWDVFLDGVGATLGARLGADPGVSGDAARLLAAARRQRALAYAALGKALAGPGQRALERRLACLAALRPWEAGPGAVLLGGDATGFAAAVLAKRLRRVRRAGRGFKALPAEALHGLRKDGKRLRYAAEAFAPLFPDAATRRFLKRLRLLQGALGELQDAEVARGLLGRLGTAGRGYAGGLALGHAEGRGDARRAEAAAAWRRFRRAEPFWE